MPQVFVPHLDPECLLQEVVRRGWAFVPQALDREFCLALACEVEAAPYRRVLREMRGVREEYEVMEPLDSAYPSSNFPVIAELGDRVGQLVRGHRERLETLASWRPNEAAVQRYRSPTAGITRHRDYMADVLLIASFTVQGRAKFWFYAHRYQGEAVAELETEPGSFILMRGPGLIQDAEDIRPTHAVGAPLSGSRISITYRDNRKRRQ
jgi:alkylated DNA repair dioxygenase AlkB